MPTTAAALVALLFVAACGTKVKEAPVKRLYAHFTRVDVIDHTNALRSIIDWPRETRELQKAWGLSPAKAKELMPSLQALWDEKLEDYATGNFEVLKTEPETCATLCHCTFYQASVDKFPELAARGVIVPEVKEGKKELLQCQKNWRANPQLLAFLKTEAAKAQAPSAY